MRGKAQCPYKPHGACGITPAYAGKSLKRRMRQFGCQDHPRLCGEKHPLLPPPFHDIGSPPPMRGKVSELFEKKLVSGITPAYAGKSPAVLIV